MNPIDLGFQYNLSLLNICKLGVVVGVDNLSDGVVDIQIPINKLYPDNTSEEYQTFYRVKIVEISTASTSITIPVQQGDGCLVVFTDVDPTDYILGNKEPHDPPTSSAFGSHHAFCIVGANPLQESSYNVNNYKNQINQQDLNIVHNKSTGNEVVFSLKQDGSISCIAPSSVNVKSPNVVIDADSVDLTKALVTTTNDVVIKGISVFNHMTQNKHPYTDDGNPMETLPALPL